MISAASLRKFECWQSAVAASCPNSIATLFGVSRRAVWPDSSTSTQPSCSLEKKAPGVSIP